MDKVLEIRLLHNNMRNENNGLRLFECLASHFASANTVGITSYIYMISMYDVLLQIYTHKQSDQMDKVLEIRLQHINMRNDNNVLRLFECLASHFASVNTVGITSYIFMINMYDV